MNITIVLGAFLPVPPVMGGAVEKAWLVLAEEFVKRGHAILVVSRAIPQFPAEEVRSAVRHRRVPGFNTPRSLLGLKLLDFVYSVRVRRILPPADILVTNTFWLPLLVDDGKNGRVYVHVARYPKGQMRLYRHVARLQAPSSAVARAVAREVPRMEKKVTVIPYPVARATNESGLLPLSRRKKMMLFVGRLHPEKGVHLLVEAFALDASTVFADWQLMIVGPIHEKFGGAGGDYSRRLHESAADAEGQIIFSGHIFDAPKLQETFRSSSLFIYPSLAERGESFGLAALEAMAEGCAVLVSDLDCFRDFITDGETGFVFNHRARNPIDALRHRMKEVIADEASFTSVAAAGYEKAASYSVPSVADQFLNDFSTLLHKSDVSRASR